MALNHEMNFDIQVNPRGNCFKFESIKASKKNPKTVTLFFSQSNPDPSLSYAPLTFSYTNSYPGLTMHKRVWNSQKDAFRCLIDAITDCGDKDIDTWMAYTRDELVENLSGYEGLHITTSNEPVDNNGYINFDIPMYSVNDEVEDLMDTRRELFSAFSSVDEDVQKIITREEAYTRNTAPETATSPVFAKDGDEISF